ncbi:hypothetical protein DL93DRAFT_2162259 [Clavulina sp. PMI_390]|nr:hypothetical protein DL93DRAFT_2162259 [Clavulina sp. PMI_390]
MSPNSGADLPGDATVRRSPAATVFASLDTLLLIVIHLNVPGLIRLSMVSRKLRREIENNRIVWLRMLETIERVQCMVPRTYRVENMDTHALRHDACAPYRLASAILGKGVVNTAVKTFELETAEQGPPPQYAIYLIPGGRWMFHADRGANFRSGGPARISCTDLSEPTRSQRAKSFDLRLPVDTWPTIHAVQSDPDNSRIRVVVTYQHTFPTRCIEVLHATWPSNTSSGQLPTWSRAAFLEVDIDEPIRALCLEGDHITVPFSSSVLLWNWAIDRWTTISPVPGNVRDAWVTGTHIFIVADSTNDILVVEIPALIPASEPLVAQPALVIAQMPFKQGSKLAGELAVLSSFIPLAKRPRSFASIVYWNREGVSGLVLMDYSDPLNMRVLNDWENSPNDSLYGIHSGALQTIDVDGIAIRAGRRFLSRLLKGPEGLEFRVLAYNRQAQHAAPWSLQVQDLDGDWDQAEAYDCCTIFGRILLRQYDSSSDSEQSEGGTHPLLALMDFI